MKTSNSYKKELDSHNKKIKGGIGKNLRHALFHKCGLNDHIMDQKEDDFRHFYSEDYSEVSREIDENFFDAETVDYENYIKEIDVGDNN